jgi:hypothetical protein
LENRSVISINARGSALIVLLGLILLLTLGAGFHLIQVEQALKGRRRFVELEERKRALQYIFLSIDCPATFASAGINPLNAAQCPSASTDGDEKPPYLRLRRRSLATTQPYWLSGDLNPDGTTRIGDWLVRISCSTTEKTLVVKSIDRLGKERLGSVGQNLFGVGPDLLPLCASSF